MTMATSPAIEATRSDLRSARGKACLGTPSRFPRTRFGDKVLLNAFLNNTRTSQKIIKISGRTPSRKTIPVLRNNAGNSCGRAKNKEEKAIDTAKHIRHRCRAQHCAQETPGRSEHQT